MNDGALRSDRAAGVVLGGAAGDALGAGYEFGPALPPDEPVSMKGGGGFGWDPGEWTDDTQMASAVLSPLAIGATGIELVEAVAAGFLTWFDSGPPDIGNQTRRTLQRAHGSPSALPAAAASVHADSPDAAGNGSLMRTGPLGIMQARTSDERARTVTAVSELTHAHSDCASACVLWCDAIHRFCDLPAGPPTVGSNISEADSDSSRPSGANGGR